MKRLLLLPLFCALCGSIFAAPVETKPAATNQTASAVSPPTPGVEAAKALSTITGVAISPLLGVGAVGAWEYYSARVEKRAQLPWFAQPWFWVPALLIVVLAGLKDLLGTGTPPLLKKPFDMAEVIENKISGLVAAGLFVPLIISIFPHATGTPESILGGTGAAGFAMIDGASLLNALLLPFALLVFGVVWMVSHAINILILLSPFGAVDAALKSFRLFLMSLITAASFANPYLGALVSLVIIVLAWLLVGWAFRLMVFGHMFVWDFFTLRRARFAPEANANRMFTARRLGPIPARTYGKLLRDERGQLAFAYRPWLLLPQRAFALPTANYAVGRGLFYPEIMSLEKERGKTRTLFVLPPRYCTHEAALAEAYGLGAVRDVGLLKGCKAIWNWIKGRFRWTKNEVAPIEAIQV